MIRTLRAACGRPRDPFARSRRSLPSRRALFQGLGALAACGVVGLPRPAQALKGKSARRILFFVTGHGTVHDQWQMPGSASLDTLVDRPLGSLAESEFSHILQPLWPFRDRLLVVDGLANYAGMTAATNEHDEGHASCLTGTVPVEVPGSIAVASGQSVDQLIAGTRGTPIRSLEYSVGGWSVNFDAAGQPIPYEGDIWAAYRRLFPDGTDPDGSPSVADRVRAHRSSVLALAEGRFDRLSQRLTGGDRVRLEQHRDLLRDLDTQLQGLAELDCEVPPEPYGLAQWGTPTWAEEQTRAFLQLAQTAFACGMTDVITVRQDSVDTEAIGAPAGDIHNDVAHNVSLDPAAADTMAEYHRWHAQRFAEVVAMLDAVPEGDGTMLDETLCVWTNELATGDHSQTRHPFVIAGGTNVLETGRYVSFPPERDFAGPWGSYDDTGPAHNRMLVTLARAMGVDVNTMGDAGFTDWAGAPVDAAGELPGLLKP